MRQLHVAHGPRSDEWDDGDAAARPTPYLVRTAATAAASRPSPAPLSVIPAWGVPLQRGQPFDPGVVGAIITQQGLFIWAMPTQYFDTTPGGVKIRLRQLTGPEPMESDRKIEEWNAVGEVARLVTVEELRTRREGVTTMGVANPPVLPGTANRPSQRDNRSFWVQGLIALALLAAIAVVWLMVFGVITLPDAPTLTTEQLAALMGTGALLILGAACLAVVQNTAPR